MSLEREAEFHPIMALTRTASGVRLLRVQIPLPHLRVVRTCQVISVPQFLLYNTYLVRVFRTLGGYVFRGLSDPPLRIIYIQSSTQKAISF